MDWPGLKELMLERPKPAMSFVIHQHDPHRDRSARVLHDGDTRWLIWSSERLEVNNGRRAVVVADERVTTHWSADLYSHGWIKSMVHPRLTNIGEEESSVSAGVIKEVSVEGSQCWRAEIAGLSDDDPVVFTVDVEKTSGSIVRLRRPDMDALLDIHELKVGVPVPPNVFDWVGDVDGEPER